MIPGKGCSGGEGEDPPLYELIRSLEWKQSIQARMQTAESCDDDASSTNSLMVNPDDESGQRSGPFIIPPQDQALPISYSPLDEDLDEMRLITILAPSESSSLVCCTLETVSLKSETLEYRAFISKSLSPATKNSRKMAINWVNLHNQNVSGSSDHNGTAYPTRSRYRFTWGDYAALSYVWGDPTQTHHMIVNGKMTRARRNLETALRALSRDPVFKDGLKLWVDAICINQRDYQERGHQIGKMRSIYGNAQTVIAWLGEEDRESNKAIELVQRLCYFARTDNSGEEIEAKLRLDPKYLGFGCWVALHDLMLRNFWYRLWIIQEIVLGASSLVLQCGSTVVDWMSFCEGIGFLYDHLWNVKDDLLIFELKARGPNAPHRHPNWTTLSLHLVYQDLWALSQREAQGGGDRLSFTRLLDLANVTISKDDRDKVYGLVGMMEPIIARALIPDYKLDVSQVYTEITKIFISTYDNLEPLREGNPWGKTNSPSWTADWTWNGRIRHRRPEINLWGPGTGPFWHQKGPLPITRAAIAYKASGEAMEISFSNNDLHLTCRGFLTDEICGLTAREQGYFEWTEQSVVQPEQENNAYGDYDGVTKALYRALVMDRVAGGERASERHAAILNLPFRFKNALGQFERLGWRWLSSQEGYYFRWERWRRANWNFRLMGRTLDEYFSEIIPEDASEYDYTEVYSCFDRTCKARRLMTTKNGYIGWAPDNLFGSDEDQARVGDKIAIIFGCSTPIVIRPQGNHFLVLGEAYVQGLMDGEALEFLKSGQCDVQDFLFY